MFADAACGTAEFMCYPFFSSLVMFLCGVLYVLVFGAVKQYLAGRRRMRIHTQRAG